MNRIKNILIIFFCMNLNLTLIFPGQIADGITNQIGTDEYIAPYHDADLKDSESQVSIAKKMANKLFSVNSDDDLSNDVEDKSYNIKHKAKVVAKFDPMLQKEIVHLFDENGNKTHSISTGSDYSEIKKFSADGSIISRELKSVNDSDVVDVDLLRSALKKDPTFISTKKTSNEKKAYFKLSTKGKVVRVSIKK